ncbi:uncharacterized protein LOC121394351 [Xenopus laevis]|uniref:Uncharacterized protein LOC121394351 n=1 Tax=Xenopus laevis TaxID=8355 RepID=A0A8J1KUY1_XENLA|nr:uncharacterized protein LOC121394351 [Xenopus laevis]
MSVDVREKYLPDTGQSLTKHIIEVPSCVTPSEAKGDQSVTVETHKEFLAFSGLLDMTTIVSVGSNVFVGGGLEDVVNTWLCSRRSPSTEGGTVWPSSSPHSPAGFPLTEQLRAAGDTKTPAGRCHLQHRGLRLSSPHRVPSHPTGKPPHIPGLPRPASQSRTRAGEPRVPVSRLETEPLPVRGRGSRRERSACDWDSSLCLLSALLLRKILAT